MAKSVTLAATGDERIDRVKPVWKKRITFIWENTDTGAQSQAVPLNGVIMAMIAQVNDNTGNRTITLALVDDLAGSLFSAAGIAENATTVKVAPTDFVEIPVNGTLTVTVTPSGDPGATGMTAIVELRGL